MRQPTHHGERLILMRTLRLAAMLFSLTTICPAQNPAQLPAGTTDTTQTQQPQPQDPILAQATEALNKQDYPTALKLLTSLAEKNPSDARILFDLAYTQEALNQSTEAAATYRRAIAADATFLDPHVALGLLLARSGQLTDAHAELAKAVTLDNGNPAFKASAYRALARLDRAQNPAAASDEILSAIKLTPETPEDTLLSGEIAEASGNTAAAEAAYRRLLAANPNNQDATSALAHLQLSQKQPAEQTESLLTAALAKDPDNPTLNAQLASLYDRQDKPAQAIPLILKLHAAHPDDADITRLLAHLYTHNQQYDQAAPLYAALASSSNDPTLLDDYGETLIRLKRFAEAETVLQRATANPAAFTSKDDLGDAAAHLAFAASANNDPATTLKAIELRATVLPPSPSSLFLAATAHDKLRHIKQAADLYKQFLTVANGKFPDEEWEARHRLITLNHMK